jgi:putative acetyltransferase
MIVSGQDAMSDPARSRSPSRAAAVTPPATPSHRVERATARDVSEVIALIGRVFVEYRLVLDQQHEVPELLAFDLHYAAPRGAFFVIRDNGAVVGSVGVERMAPGSAELRRLYLEPTLRGRGLGRALVAAVLDWCRDAGIPHLYLWSDTRFDRSHLLYERMGFTRTGLRHVADVNQSREYRFELHVDANARAVDAGGAS